jgi:hypothetical protein
MSWPAQNAFHCPQRVERHRHIWREDENTAKAFQKKCELEIDGIVGPQRFEKIDKLRGKLLGTRPTTAAEKASREMPFTTGDVRFEKPVLAPVYT